MWIRFNEKKIDFWTEYMARTGLTNKENHQRHDAAFVGGVSVSQVSALVVAVFARWEPIQRLLDELIAAAVVLDGAEIRHEFW